MLLISDLEVAQKSTRFSRVVMIKIFLLSTQLLDGSSGKVRLPQTGTVFSDSLSMIDLITKIMLD